MVVDLNRQSLDRVIPDIAATRLQRFFSHAGWHVAEAKYGARLRGLFAEPGGDALRAHIDAMPNEAYQALFTYRGPERRKKFLDGADAAVRRLVKGFDDEELFAHLSDLGGHDLGQLIECFRACDAEVDRPSVVFAYTIKGWGLPMAGDPLNHAVLLTPEQIDALRAEMGLTEANEWDRFDPDSPEGRLCDSVGSDINNPPARPRPRLGLPAAAGPATLRGKVSTQEAFGRTLDPPGRRPPRSAGAWSPPRRTCRSPPTWAAGSTKWACTPTTSGTTTGAPSGCCGGRPRRKVSTSSWASRR